MGLVPVDQSFICIMTIWFCRPVAKRVNKLIQIQNVYYDEFKVECENHTQHVKITLVRVV
jgi:hypothetical protein